LHTWIDRLIEADQMRRGQLADDDVIMRFPMPGNSAESLEVMRVLLRNIFGGTLECRGVRRDVNDTPKFLIDTDQGELEFATFASVDGAGAPQMVNLYFLVPADWDLSHGPLGALRRNLRTLGLRYQGRSQNRREHLWNGPWDEFWRQNESQS
jgi:hypothetical protein